MVCQALGRILVDDRWARPFAAVRRSAGDGSMTRDVECGGRDDRSHIGAGRSRRSFSVRGEAGGGVFMLFRRA